MKKFLLLIIALGFTGSFAFSQFQIKNVVVEEMTGTWCGWCPDGAVILNNIVSNYPGRAFGVAVHASGGDPMEFTEGAMIASEYNDGFPSGIIDREGIAISRSAWMGTVNQRLQTVSPAVVSFNSLTFDPQTRQIDVEVQVTFDSPLTGEFVFNCFVVEDSVTGGASYNQVNYLNSQPGHPYQGAGDPIVGFVHNHVLRHCMGGAWGTPNIIADTITGGMSFTHNYSYVLPAGYDENQISLVAYVGNEGNDINSREIINSEEMHLPIATSIGAEADFNNFLEVGPNPFSERLYIAYGLENTQNVLLEVFNPMGQKVRTLLNTRNNSGAHSFEWDGRNDFGQQVANGVYLVTLTAGEQRITKRVMLRH